MSLEDIQIDIKTYDRKENFVVLNLLVCGEIEIRGFVVRYTTTKYSAYPVWIASPPSIRGKNRKYFWVVNIKNLSLWRELQEEMIRLAKEHTEI